MTTKNSLDSLFRPKSIAVIGASGTPTKIGGVPIAHLLRYGFKGPIYPINPQYESIQELRAYKSVKDVGQEIDLAIVAVPAASALKALNEAAEAKVKSVVLFTSGFAEVGEAGAKAQQQIAELSRKSGMRILGPNCLGVMSGASAVYATFSPVAGTGIAKVGHIGLVSQSGAFGGFAYSLARERGLGLSHWVTTGNESDIELADCLDWLVDDDATKVILAYMEGCRDGAKLLRALREGACGQEADRDHEGGAHRARRGGGGLAHGGAGGRGRDLRCGVQAVWRLARRHDRGGVRRRLRGVGRRRGARQVDWHADGIRRCRRHDGGCGCKPRSGRADRCRRRRRSKFSRACRLRRRSIRSMSPARSPAIRK